MKKPNFFIVGAPKSGTTAMNDYLARHPDIFMATKELHYFGSDLLSKEKISKKSYLEHFEKVKTEKVVGEASVWYLYSTKAAEEIKSFSGDARILIMLRNPADLIHSIHSQHLFDGNEDVLDFETAINLDDERRQGKKLPDSIGFTALPPYRDSVLFSQQIQRYLDVFPPEQIHIILYDDFVSDTAASVRDTLRFLGVNEKFDIDFRKVNPNKKIRYFWLHRLLKNPSGKLKSIVRFLLPFKSVRHKIMSGIFKRNVSDSPRENMPGHIFEELKKELADDVTTLEKLINRDLSAWR